MMMRLTSFDEKGRRERERKGYRGISRGGEEKGVGFWFLKSRGKSIL